MGSEASVAVLKKEKKFLVHLLDQLARSLVATPIDISWLQKF
jgi:hypothetical protein